MNHLEGLINGPRPGKLRDRRGRGKRGPFSLPGPLSPAGVPSHRRPRGEFDFIVGEVVNALQSHLDHASIEVQFAVEEAPLLPEDWSDDVPVSTIVTAGETVQIVLFRLPMTHRSFDESELLDLLWNTILDRLAEIWQVSPHDIDPRRRK